MPWFAALTETISAAGETALSDAPSDVVFTGTLREVDDFFYEREWSDGLPFVPPTVNDVKEFLRYTDLPGEHVLAIMLPERRKANVWSIAVNGVMAGCRPEYMPILIAIVEALADPAYGVENSGTTPGSETLIVLDGPIVRELGFNYEQGVLRDGIRPNTTIGRFLRLYLRNIVGFLPHKTDKACFGNTWRVVLAENMDALRRIGWEPLCVDVGLQAPENAVTIARYSGGNVIASVSGSTPEDILPYIADAVLNQNTWQLYCTVGSGRSSLRPLLVLSPILAEMIARSGWSRDDVKQYLFDHCRHPAWKFERYVSQVSSVGHVHGGFLPHRESLNQMVELGELPAVFGESRDPRLPVPLVFDARDYMIAVSGDPLRTNAYTFSHNGLGAYPVGKRIRLPENWAMLPKEYPR